jgi:hypothetical protein
MGYVNDGYKRATTLTIKVNGTVAATLPFTSAFTQSGISYPTISNADLQKLSTTDYNSRVTAYAAYVTANYQASYPGLAVSADGARIYDATACPLP